MKICSAKISDAEAIYSLVSFYAEQDKMLFRSMADIYENIQDFLVAESDGQIAGCCSLQVIWSDLAEIKSLAVDKSMAGRGAGKGLVEAATKRAAKLGLLRIFALTLVPDFFEKIGFEIVEKDTLPMKVWSDCAKCPKADHCDEIAVVKRLKT